MTPRVFRLEQALDKLDGERHILIELAQSYLDSQQGYIGAIEQGISGDNMTVVEDAAHVLKGMLGYFGCEMLVREVAMLEQFAAEKKSAIVKSSYTLMQEKLIQLGGELEQFVSSRKQ